MNDRDRLLIGLLGSLHRLTPAVLGMAERLPPAERLYLLNDWRQSLRFRRRLVQDLLPIALPAPTARRRLERDLEQGEQLLCSSSAAPTPTQPPLDSHCS